MSSIHGSPNPWDEADGLDNVLKYAQELGYTTQRSAVPILVHVSLTSR